MPFKNSDNLSEKCNLCEFNNNCIVDYKNNLKTNHEYEQNMNESVNFQSNCKYNYNNETLYKIQKPKIKSNIDRHLLIQIRNARERSRIFEINKAFFRLSQAVPYTVGRSKRISKVKTLQKALQYISELERQLYSGFINDDDNSNMKSNH